MNIDPQVVIFENEKAMSQLSGSDFVNVNSGNVHTQTKSSEICSARPIERPNRRNITQLN